ncbi:MAG: FHA domain-containing protein [Planctomycetota bacterium]
MIEPLNRLELEIEDGPRAGETVTVEASPYLVGRDQAADLFLDDSSVSRIHMALVHRDGQWFLQDLGGTNPPTIHGRPTVSMPLIEGDRIQVGSQSMKVVTMRSGVDVADRRSTVTLPAAVSDLESYRPRQLAGAQLWSVLAEWSGMIGNVDRLAELVETALDSYLRVIPADRGGIYRLDEETGVLVPVSTRHLEGDDPVGAGQALYSETIIAKSIQARAAKLYAPETVEPEDSTARSRSMIRKRIRNALCIPLLGENRVRGIVYPGPSRADLAAEH